MNSCSSCFCCTCFDTNKTKTGEGVSIKERSNELMPCSKYRLPFAGEGLGALLEVEGFLAPSSQSSVTGRTGVEVFDAGTLS